MEKDKELKYPKGREGARGNRGFPLIKLNDFYTILSY